jgi:hypothetical protein
VVENHEEIKDEDTHDENVSGDELIPSIDDKNDECCEGKDGSYDAKEKDGVEYQAIAPG